MEERLFRRLERVLVSKKLRAGFGGLNEPDVDGFVSFSLSVQNRRKVRAGLALEDHLAEIFRQSGVNFSQRSVTENNAKPDFIFPGITEYRDHVFPATNLAMLGAKASCKDRWRQVLTEAARIPEKHLFTLEPGISENQTSEMRSHHLQLVLPQGLHHTYTTAQRSWLMNLGSFIGLVRAHQ